VPQQVNDIEIVDCDSNSNPVIIECISQPIKRQVAASSFATLNRNSKEKKLPKN
jgi:hypothetical protein